MQENPNFLAQLKHQVDPEALVLFRAAGGAFGPAARLASAPTAMPTATTSSKVSRATATPTTSAIASAAGVIRRPALVPGLSGNKSLPGPCATRSNPRRICGSDACNQGIAPMIRIPKQCKSPPSASDRFNVLADNEAQERIRAACARLGDRRCCSATTTSAPTCLPARRPHRRLAEARPPGLADRRRVHRVLRRALHGRGRRHPVQAQPDRHPAGPRRRLSMADMASLAKVERCWRELAGCSTSPDEMITPGHLHQLGGRPQGLLQVSTAASCAPRPTRRPSSTGRSPGARRCCSSRPAPRALDRLQKEGHPADEMVVWDPDLMAASRPEQTRRRSCCGGPLLGENQMFQPVHIDRWREKHPQGFDHLPTRGMPRGCARSPTTSAPPVHPQHHHPGAAQHPLAGGHRAQPGEPAGRGDEAAGQGGAVHGADGVHVLDHAAHRPAAPGVDAGEPRRGQGEEPDQGAAHEAEFRPHRSRPHARCF